MNNPRQLLNSAILERDAFKAQIANSHPNSTLRLTGHTTVRQLNDKVEFLQLQCDEHEAKYGVTL